MNDEKELIKKRFLDLARKSDNGYYNFSDFLGLSEQDAFAAIKKEIRVPYITFGGVEGAERVMIRFGDSEDIGYDLPFPIRCLKIQPRSLKFAERLTHRDYLGAILNLGIERSSVGDIVIREKDAYLFIKEELASYVMGELTRVRHTDVMLCEVEDIPKGELYSTERKHVQVVSERIDALIARVFSTSREDSQSLFKKRLVFLNGAECESSSKILKPNDKVSVRGYGRFIYLGYETLTKKGRLNAVVEVYV